MTSKGRSRGTAGSARTALDRSIQRVFNGCVNAQPMRWRSLHAYSKRDDLIAAENASEESPAPLLGVAKNQ